MDIAGRTGDIVLSLSNVRMRYKKGWLAKEFEALRGINIEIRSGETVGFIGNNGAGKSTTLRIVLGLQKVTSGRVMLNALPVENPLSRKGVSYVPENPYLYDYLTPAELLRLGIKMHAVERGKDSAWINNHVMYWLGKFKIDHVSNKRIRSFSKGMTQRAALAHALACNPKFLILDEPLSGLDPIGRKEVVDILDEYRQGGGTLFFSSHVLHDVERLADRFIFINEGEIKAVCSTLDILPEESNRFVVALEGEHAPSGFERISARFWQGELLMSELAMLLEFLKGNKEIRLYSVKNMSNLERAYFSFVQREKREG